MNARWLEQEISNGYRDSVVQNAFSGRKPKSLWRATSHYNAGLFYNRVSSDTGLLLHCKLQWMCEAGCHLYFRMEAKASLMEDERQSGQGAGAFPRLLARDFFLWSDWILHFSQESPTPPVLLSKKGRRSVCAWGCALGQWYLHFIGKPPSASPAFCNAAPKVIPCQVTSLMLKAQHLPPCKEILMCTLHLFLTVQLLHEEN